MDRTFPFLYITFPWPDFSEAANVPSAETHSVIGLTQGSDLPAPRITENLHGFVLLEHKEKINFWGVHLSQQADKKYKNSSVSPSD